MFFIKKINNQNSIILPANFFLEPLNRSDCYRPSAMAVKSFTSSEQLQSQAIFPLVIALCFEFIKRFLGC
jgi:hypothetical protein